MGSGLSRPHQLRTPIPAFLGTTVYGNGFFLSPEEASPLLDADQRNARVLRRFLNGDDVLASPTPNPTRYVLFFQGMDEQEVAAFPRPYSIAKERVWPHRNRSSSKRRREKWWLYTSPANALYEAIRTLPFVFVTCFTSKYVVFASMGVDMIFSNAVIVIASSDYCCFGALQSSFHEAWVREHSSTLETEQRYALSDCYETFPMPAFGESLRASAREYHERRSAAMKALGIGLTELYNRFHSPANLSQEIAELRRLHVEVDQQVVAAYGWRGVNLDHGFSVTNQGVRFTVSESTRRKILDRLLELNNERYSDEVRQGLHANGSGPKARGRKKRATDDQTDLFS